MRANDGGVWRERGDFLEDVRPTASVRFHLHPLAFVEGSRLIEDRRRNEDLADIVQDRAPFDELDLGIGEPERGCDPPTPLSDAPRMHARRNIVPLEPREYERRFGFESGRDARCGVIRALQPYIHASFPESNAEVS